MFPLHMQWTMQLSPLLGELEVEKLDTKLRSLNVTGIDHLHLDFTQFFPVQCSSELERERLLRLINNIGSWHQVRCYLPVSSLLPPGHWICLSFIGLKLRSRQSDLGNKVI